MGKSISISILNSGNVNEFFNTLNEVKEKINKKKIGKDLFDINIHFDVMDGKFVDNIGVDLGYIKLAKDMGFYTDVHLMVKEPILDRYIENAIAFGADEITIHYEIENFEETLKYLNVRKNKILKYRGRNIVIGVAIKTDTPVEELRKYKDLFDKILIMSVEAGYGGQEYNTKVNDKLRTAKVLFENHIIEVDGGIDIKTIEEPLRYGVESFVIGMYLIKLSKNKLYSKILSFNIKNDIEMLPKDVNLDFEKTILQIVPQGYAEHDTLLGINIPNIRKIAKKWYKFVDEDILNDYISSDYHEYRRFAIYCLSYLVKYMFNEDKEAVLKINEYIEKNMRYINNWDLTDEVAPNITAKYFNTLNVSKLKEKLNEYLNDENIWKKRIGIVSMLPYAKEGNDKIVLWVVDKVIYDEYHLFQKASGWVLRELYKTKKEVVIKYLKEKNNKKKVPSILLSYACEKMSKEEKIM